MPADGYLKYLEVHNFKSYKGTQRIGPFKKFSCIIGPNGSGKSNLVDAISFVLGVKTAHLRGSQLTDLIFRVEGEGRRASSAYVKLVYATHDEEETEFMRVVEGDEATFHIDGRQRSWAQYNAALEKLSIIVQAKNFLVFQGDVESIATKSPKALMELFEEISGSGALKAEYEELLALKETAEETTRFNEKKRKGINAEKMQFDAQMSEADKYEKLVRRKKDLMVDYMLFQLYHIKQDLAKHEKVVLAHRRKLAELQEERLALNDQLHSKKTAQGKYRKQALKIEQAIRKLRREGDKARPALIAAKEEMEHLTKRIAAAGHAQQDKVQSLEAHAGLVADLEQQLAALQQERTAFESAMAQEEAENVALSGPQLAEYTEKKQEVARQTAVESSQLDQLRREQRLDEQENEALLARQDEYRERLAQLQERQGQLAARVLKVEELQEVCHGRKAEAEGQLAASRKQTKQADKRKLALEQKIEEIQAELRERRADLRETKREQKLKELLKNLSRLFPAVRGRLLDLVEPREQYQLAVTITLGKNMDAIVVDDEKTALECLHYMKEQRLGTATFIPLDTIKVKPVDERLRQDANAKLVMDVMKFDHAIKRAVQYACGDTVVCETLDDAKAIAYGTGRGLPKTKVVTRKDGVLIRKSGMITGGVSTSLVSRVRGWDQKDLQALKDKRDTLLSELADVGRTLRLKNKEELLLNQLAGLDTRLAYIGQDLALTRTKLADAQADQQTLQEKLADELAPLLATLEARLAQQQQAVAALDEAVAAREAAVFGDFAERAGIEGDIHAYEERRLHLAKRKAQRGLELANAISKLDSQLQYEASRDLAAALSSEQASVEELQAKLEALQDEYRGLKAAGDARRKQLVSQEKALGKVNATMAGKDDGVGALKDQIDALVGKMAAVQKQLAVAEGIVDQNRTRRHNIYQTCRVEEIWALMPVSDDGMELDSPAESEEEGSGSQAIYDREDAISMSFRQLGSHLKTAAQHDKHVLDYKNQLHAIRLAIDEIDPNLKASVHLKRVKARLGKTKGDLNEARAASDEAAQQFQEVRKRRIATFNASFKPIAAEIDAIYKALTTDSGRPGGTAYLNVDNTAEPYLGGVRFHVMPPSKRFRDMEQLSGGEKTVAALALLFAMHSIHPAPFFLLDEVDAALDKANIAKVARYLQARKRDIQFVVVSLQDRFYENADSLVGVMFDQSQRCSSTLTLDLAQYN